MNKPIGLLLTFLTGLLLPLAAQSYSPPSWSGTGWALNSGYVVTNHHVVEDARTIVCRFYKGNDAVEYYAQVVEDDERNDLAILRINDPDFTGFGTLPYAFKQTLADVGESVFVLGYPMTTTMGDEIKLTTGIISSHSGYENDATQYQISAPVQPGNSGGALFDDDGNVIGIINAKHTGAENVSYAIKAQYLLPLVRLLPEGKSVLPTVNRIQALTLPQKVKLVRECVCYIICTSQGHTASSSAYSDYSAYSGNSGYSGSAGAPQSREYLRTNIEEWGDCRNVAITQTNGDVALHGRNGWAGVGLPKTLSDALHELNEANEYIDDVQLTEKGRWCVLYGNNGFRWYDIPASLEKEIREYHSDNEIIYSVTFNDSGDWILISKEHYSASDSKLLEWLKEGCNQYGALWAACITEEGIVACYEGGYKFYGDVPEELKQRLRETDLDVYRIKIAGNAYFFADKEGHYRYKM